MAIGVFEDYLLRDPLSIAREKDGNYVARPLGNHSEARSNHRRRVPATRLGANLTPNDFEMKLAVIEHPRLCDDAPVKMRTRLGF
jgi:hypothetical protein